MSHSRSCPPAAISAVDQRVAGSSRGEPRRSVAVADVVAGRVQRPQQQDRRGRGVEPDRVADPGVLARVATTARSRPACRPPAPTAAGPAAAAIPATRAGPLGVGDVHRHPVGSGLLERERHRDDPAVELGDRHLHGRVHRRQRARRGRPTSPATLVRHSALDHRHVQRRQRGDVPGVLVAAGRRVGRGRAARRRARSRSARRPRPAGRRPRRRRRAASAQKTGRHVRPARLDRVGQHVDERGVARHRVRPVEDDPDGRPVGLDRPRRVQPEGRQRRRRVEAEPGQQQRVGQEVRPARPGWPGRPRAGRRAPRSRPRPGTVEQRHQRRRRASLRRRARGSAGRCAEHGVELRPSTVARAAQQPDDDERCAREQLRHVARPRPGPGWPAASRPRWRGRRAGRCRRPRSARRRMDSRVSRSRCTGWDERQAGRRAVLDQAAQGVRCRGGRRSGRRARRAAVRAARRTRCPAPARTRRPASGGDLAQERAAELVVLERAVPGRPPHRTDAACRRGTARPPSAVDDTVVDLVARAPARRAPTRTGGRAPCRRRRRRSPAAARARPPGRRRSRPGRRSCRASIW